jgi:hypothetical protein
MRKAIITESPIGGCWMCVVILIFKTLPGYCRLMKTLEVSGSGLQVCMPVESKEGRSFEAAISGLVSYLSPYCATLFPASQDLGVPYH